MDDHSHHDHLIQRISEEYREILDESAKGVFIYLDDNHKVVNKKFAKMLGYGSPAELEAITVDPVGKIVVKEDQDKLVDAFWKANDKFEGSHLDIIWKKKNGSRLKTNLIIVPISFMSHIFALHFVSPVS